MRRPTFDFSNVSPHWFDGDAFSSHVMHAFSVTFPDGERFFIESVRKHLPLIKDAALRDEVTRFFAQEALHGELHEGLNDRLRAVGFDTAAIEEDARARLQRLQEKWSPRTQLAITLAWEHFTAILSEYLFRDAALRESWAPVARELWEWHAIEETEHKSVPFDVYQAAGGGYFLRCVSLLMTTAKYLPTIARYQAHLLRQEPTPPDRRMMLKGAWRWLVWPGYLRRIFPAWLDYLRPGYHPSQRKLPPDFEVLKARFAYAVVRGAEGTSRSA